MRLGDQHGPPVILGIRRHIDHFPIPLETRSPYAILPRGLDEEVGFGHRPGDVGKPGPTIRLCHECLRVSGTSRRT